MIGKNLCCPECNSDRVWINGIYPAGGDREHDEADCYCGDCGAEFCAAICEGEE